MARLFPEKLHLLRQRHAVTQVVLAERLGLSSQAHIANIESGRDTASLDVVIRIARFFGVTTDYLLRDTIPVAAAPSSTITTGPIQMGFPPHFGARLSTLRLQLGWGQTELARGLGLARRGYISNLETGRKAPSMELVVKIADLFGVTTDDLLRGESTAPLTQDK